jgi:hypothetical protein
MSIPTSLTRAVFTAGAVGIALTSRTAIAQTADPQERTWETRVTSGALVPTGGQRNFLDDAQVTAIQVSRVLRPSLAITGTFGWARSRDVAAARNPKVDVFTSDLGIELRPRQWFAGRAVTFDAFVGVGAGARSYNYRRLDEPAAHNIAGYGAVGGELGLGRVGLRLELRDYVSGFKPLASAGKSHTSNDVMITAALRFNRHRVPQN